jgi:TRAP-type mannitol/chloroaromatic compound transport system substrate-binding protein
VGRKLYDELMEALEYDLVIIPLGPVPGQNLGWFPFQLTEPADLDGLKYRTAGLANELAAELGMVPTSVGAGALAASLSDGTVDAAEFNTPASDLALGLHVAEESEPCEPEDDCRFVLHLGGLGQPGEWFDLVFNRDVYDGLTTEQQQLLHDAADLASAEFLLQVAAADAEALPILEADVDVVPVPESIILAQREAFHAVLDCPDDDPADFFCRVVASIEAFADTVVAITELSGLRAPAPTP